MDEDKNERIICGFINFFNRADENGSISQDIQKLTFDGVIYISTKLIFKHFYNEIKFIYKYNDIGNITLKQYDNLKTIYIFPIKDDVAEIMDEFYREVMVEYITASDSYKKLQDWFKYFMGQNESDYDVEEHIVAAKKKFKKG